MERNFRRVATATVVLMVVASGASAKLDTKAYSVGPRSERHAAAGTAARAPQLPAVYCDNDWKSPRPCQVSEIPGQMPIWAMMIIGFGTIGVVERARRNGHPDMSNQVLANRTGDRRFE